MKSNLPDITVIILTFNEEIHIRRCLESLQNIAKKIIVIDSYSTDKTKDICEEYHVDFYQRKWNHNHAEQLNWAIDNCKIDTHFTMKMDSDEYLTTELIGEIIDFFTTNNIFKYNGYILKRGLIVKGRQIKHGDFKIQNLLRIWKTGKGRSEERWMDEHIQLENPSLYSFQNLFFDENLNSINWWTQKHINYARRESHDYLISKYSNLSKNNNQVSNSSAKTKRILKNKLYDKSPLFLRAFLYFIYRYFFKLGFLDGKQGLIWHFLQGFWYRFLVDVNIYEIEKEMDKNPQKINEFLKENKIQ